jgi:Amt family ammonium transporter
MCTGLFATLDGCLAFGVTNPGGAIAGNGIQVAYQLAGACFIMGWNTVWTIFILWCISWVVPLRMTEEELLMGDDAVHGEAAYVYDYELLPGSLINGDMTQRPANGDGELGYTEGMPVTEVRHGETANEMGPGKKMNEGSGSDEAAH